ncbi:hypothetical protein DPMN_096200 [Dreissena polymorpha]|uniref:Uncharacterized protein n=1 Tax=Dreissena polymorpha TaxID=45954 RepID=A0A9D4L9B2_DREPO|nr:hypothetical protein DPMN_096200 [Dreissena polymorpha]
MSLFIQSLPSVKLDLDIVQTNIQGSSVSHDINKTNVLTNFHDNWAKIVTSKVFTRENCHYIHREKNASPTVFSPISTIMNSSRTSIEPMNTAPPPGGHVFQWIRTTFELNQVIIKTNILTNFELGRDFIGTKLLTKFHEDGTINVASRVFTSNQVS